MSVCSEPPVAIRQLSGQSSLEPCLPEEIIELLDDNVEQSSTPQTHQLSPISTIINPVDLPPPTTPPKPSTPVELNSPSRSGILKKSRPDSLPLVEKSAIIDYNKSNLMNINQERIKNLQRSNSSRTYDRPKWHKSSRHDDSIFYIRSEHRTLQHDNDFYDSEQVINERRTTLLKADSETALGERKLSSLSIPAKILEQAVTGTGSGTKGEHNNAETKPPDDTILQIELDSNKI